MSRVYDCIVQQHDWRLLLLAFLLLSFGAFTTVMLLQQAVEATARRNLWIGLASAAAASVVWFTHFLALLAYDFPLAPSYGMGLTAFSAVPVLLGTAAAFWLRIASRSRWSVLLGGVLLGLGISAMHYLGMAAIDLGVPVSWDRGYVAASVLLAVGFSILVLAAPGALPEPAGKAAAGIAFVLVVGILHFVGMTAFEPNAPPANAPKAPPPPLWLGLSVVAIGIAIILSAVGCSLMARRRMQRRVEEAARLRNFSNVAIEGLLITDGQQIIAANQSFLRLYGNGSTDLEGFPLKRLIGGRALTELREEPEGTIEGTLRAADGEAIPLELAARRAEYGGSEHLVIAFRDLRARREAERKMRRLAYSDTLTGLANRVSFTRQLSQALARAKREGGSVGVLALDLDDFKAVNDTLGHGTGDRLLKIVAERIEHACREGDIIARLGGDEFAVVQSGVAQPNAAEMAGRRLAELLSRPFIIDGQVINIGTSVGIALAPRDGDSSETLLKFADMALYRAKNTRPGSYVFFETEMDEAMRARRQLESDLRLAIARSELALHYQPLIDCRTEELLGFEALLRWPREQGEVSPAVFVPLAEQCGLIVQIGRWVLRTACAEAASWPDPLFVAVNLSPAQFEDGAIVSTISDALSRSGLPPARLEVEITESLLLRPTTDVQNTLRAIRDLGVRVAMDDFGTGYSSLSSLRAFPFDRVKIDRSFVENVDTDVEAAAIVRAIVGLGTSLGMSTTAEGIETSEQLSRIAAEGCDVLQGFYFSKPVPADEVRGLIEGRRLRA